MKASNLLHKMERTIALFIITLLFFNSVYKSDAFLFKTYQSDRCLTNGNSSSVQQRIEFHEISEENCDKLMSDANFKQSVYFAKFIGFPDNNPSVILATKDEITQIANQYQASNVSNNSAESSEELNLQHFLEWFYASPDFLRERTNFAEFKFEFQTFWIFDEQTLHMISTKCVS